LFTGLAASRYADGQGRTRRPTNLLPLLEA
jgi:hypothetical protein